MTAADEAGSIEPAAQRYYCYMVRCADGSFYTGWTLDPARRVRQHNSGSGSAYTRARRPVTLIYVEEVASKRAAMKRELEIKRYPRAKKIKLAASETIPDAAENEENGKRIETGS